MRSSVLHARTGKRVLAVILSLLLLGTAHTPIGEVYASSGKADDYAGYTAIHNREELEKITQRPEGKYYLANDIDLAGKDWEPIGVTMDADGYRTLHSFCGIFDGRGHVIRNMTNHKAESCALFYQVLVGFNGNTVAIRNVKLENVQLDLDDKTAIDQGDLYRAGFICEISINSFGSSTDQHTVSLENLSVSGVIEGSECGGIVAMAQRTGGYMSMRDVTVTGCTNYADIHGKYVGGLSYNMTATWTDCANYGSITGNQLPGGLVGAGGCSFFTNCVNSGDIVSYGDSAAGIVCHSSNYYEGEAASFINCENSGNITVKKEGNSSVAGGSLGGIVGGHSSNKSSDLPGHIQNCTNNGALIYEREDQHSRAGGIAGYFNGIIEGCLNNATVHNTSGECAGIAAHFSGEIKNCHNTVAITGGSTVGGIVATGEGSSTGNALFADCSNKGALSGGGYLGGIIGEIRSREMIQISNCRNESDLSGTERHSCGGIVGCAGRFSTNDVTGILISHCDNEGNITGTGGYDGYAGGIIGGLHCSSRQQSDANLIEDCNNIGEIINGAGIVGYVYESGSDFDRVMVINNCINSGSVSGEAGAGIVFHGEIATITGCTNNGDIAVSGSTGGIADIASQVKDCLNHGNIASVQIDDESAPRYSSSEITVGGILGSSRSRQYGEESMQAYSGVYGCENSGTVTGGTYTGGIAGKAAAIAGSVNRGEVSGGFYTGGIAGQASQILESANSVDVTGSGFVGGIAGVAENDGYLAMQVLRCANTGDVAVATPGMTDSHDRISAGGILGRTETGNHDGNLLTDCYNTGDVYTALVGDDEDTRLPAVIASGGLIGSTSFNCISEVRNSYSLGNIFAGPGYGGKILAAGIVGRIEINYVAGNEDTSSKTAIVSCATLCSSIVSDWQNGIWGSEESYHYTDLFANGINHRNSHDNLWARGVLDQTESFTGESRYYLDFYEEATYTEKGWDFDEVWEIATGGGLPVLRWQKLPEGPMLDEIVGKRGSGYVARGKDGTISWAIHRTVHANGEPTYKLILDGSGNIPDYVQGGQPWSEYNAGIIDVDFVGTGIRRIGNYAFSDMPHLFFHEVPFFISTIGEYAFLNDKNIEELIISEKTVRIEDHAFIGCPDIVICGYKNTEAQRYAKANNLPFSLLGTPYGTDVELNRLYELPVHFTTHDSNDNPFYIKWKLGDIAAETAYQYNHRLAVAGLVLSAAANNSQARAEDTFKRMGFSHTASYYYGNENIVNEPGMTFASRRITAKNGKDTYLIGMTIRGTTSFGDFLTDVSAIRTGFTGAGKTAKERLVEYMDAIWDGKCTVDNTYFYITGHSYGAATASVLSQNMGDIAYTNHIHTYVYAPPAYEAKEGDSPYIHAIVNEDDTVPNMVFTQTHVGDIKKYNRKTESLNFEQAYKMLTNENNGYNDLMESRDIWSYVLYADAYNSWAINDGNTKACISHDVNTYMAFLMNHAPSGTLSKRYAKIVRVECPVDVSVYDSAGNLAGSVAGTAVSYPEHTDIVIFTEGDKKYIYMPYGTEYTLKLTGTDSGTMTYTTEIVDVAQDEAVSRKVFRDVALSKGKTMESSTMEETKVSDVRLFILNPGGEKEKEIGTDGREGKIGEVNSEEEPPGPGPGPKPQGIILVVKQKRDVSGDFANGSYKKYAVDRKDLASVNAKGLLTAKKPGTVTVTGLIRQNNKWMPDTANAIEITIEKPAFSEKTVNATRAGIQIEASELLKNCTVKPTEWTSSRPGVATIDPQTGQITTLGKGTTKITAIFGQGKQSAKYPFQLKLVIPAMSRKTASILTGATLKLSLRNTKLTPAWSSEEDTLVTVDQTGTVTALLATVTNTGEPLTASKESCVRIYAAVEGVPYPCEITVKPPVIKKATLSVTAGKTARVGLKNTKLKSISWSSSDEAIATVDETGLVTVKSDAAPGSSVTIYTEAGGVMNACVVTVK